MTRAKGKRQRILQGRVRWMLRELKAPASLPLSDACEVIEHHFGLPPSRQGLLKRVARIATIIHLRQENCPSNKAFSKSNPYKRVKLPWVPSDYDADRVLGVQVCADMAKPDTSPTQAMIDEFYASWEWKRLRYDFIREQRRRCQCCGDTPETGATIVVDHVKPIRRFWALRLAISNLQILCNSCNMGKGSRDTTDWRQR